MLVQVHKPTSTIFLLPCGLAFLSFQQTSLILSHPYHMLRSFPDYLFCCNRFFKIISVIEGVNFTSPVRPLFKVPTPFQLITLPSLICFRISNAKSLKRKIASRSVMPSVYASQVKNFCLEHGCLIEVLPNKKAALSAYWENHLLLIFFPTKSADARHW